MYLSVPNIYSGQIYDVDYVYVKIGESIFRLLKLHNPLS